MGGLLGGTLYSSMKLYVLAIAGMILLIGIIIDKLTLILLLRKRKFLNKSH
jgi:hypothetical protein